jgi:hypothetical protein
MATLISRAVTRHHARLAKAAGVVVNYVRGTDTKSLTVIALGMDNESDGIDDEFYTTRRRDFGIAADELIVGQVKIEPAEGDFIDYDGTRYSVNPVDRGRCFKVMDNLGLLLRVHTIETGAASSV